jgi:hypothetical protein
MSKIITKAGRLESLNSQFENLIKQGYKKEDYKNLYIFTLTDDISTWLKVFRGTASNPVIYKRYRTEAQSHEVIKNIKASTDRNEAYKAELKANPTKSSHSNCAKAIREELKKLYSNYKFSVKSGSFAGGDAVRVSWVDGPTVEQIDNIVNKYAYGRFDSMTDYAYSEHNDKLPQAKYVSTYREISEEVNNVVKEAVKNLFNFSNMSEWEQEREINSYAYKIISKNSIPLGATVTGIAEMQEGVFFEDRHPLTFLLPETAQTPEPKETTTFEKVEVPAGEIQIIDYSEKAIAVIGETKPIKDQLKELGGKFNFRLSCGAGWIFPKTKLEKVQELFLN